VHTSIRQDVDGKSDVGSTDPVLNREWRQ
jgi:hypothetical protein